MKFVVTWWERPQGTPEAYEGAQNRILQIFEKWKMPESFKIHQFVTSVGSWGGYIFLETDSLADIQRITTTFASLSFKVEPVMDVADAVAAEVDAITWRSTV